MPNLIVDYDALIKLLAPALVALVGAWAKRYFEGKPKLISYLVNSSSNPLPPAAPPPTQQTAAVAQPGIDAPAAAPPAVPAPRPQQPVETIHTHAIVVRNVGKRTAHDVRIDHSIFPLSYQLMPPINHTVTRQGLSAEICIPVLVPDEQVTISYLYFPPLIWGQINGWVKSNEGMAKVITAIPNVPPPRPVRWILWSLTFVGASTVVYWALRLLPFVLG